MENTQGIKNILDVGEQGLENIIKDFLESMEQMGIILVESDYREEELNEDFILEQYFETFGHNRKEIIK